ncbi:glucose 1-dehydrogenase [Paraburkholderia sp. CNPSo 3155]|uniref:NAD(P)-dependent dehydrogenase (Short-subunit alcohol dehydrogenase family) n=1 Tax=Paraburkholderia atlantica TaxID=2654982 RepID=A0A6I1Q7A0_PARAM|nr:glucose 1-dehydrogenase [Paraburkholderia atlantica]MBB5418214.1 NAD(P)-dependent dehydrogenase (short-subunit alcohol dehydrogenase family) [Paraburkholderia atlantica]MBB5429090.1 NAD(P)-dependent dehydrogenase (short-subunit alcohol dehydrogenase family) [Paraburkholderia atlantica]MPW11513.1 glucose 1-dehydrogenase [Paraburkholderia atlantica]NUY34120.1 glucose 1-dehydrogenase [Paraburkholderia atlantica]
MNRLANKVAVVTGANSGIGLATARLLVEEGANVIVVGRRADAVNATVSELGDRAIGLTGDLANPQTHDEVASLVSRRFGGLDIYFANAGINTIAPSSEVSHESYDLHFTTNTRAIFFGVQKIAPLMREHGAILLTSSIASSKVFEGHAVYAGSKAAIEAFARSWALEFQARGIRVNVISPGPVDTPILGKLGIGSAERPAFEAAVAGRIPLGRLGRPEELARAALFLVSDESSFISGINLNVDGGMSLI